MANLETQGILIDTSTLIAHFRSKRKEETNFQKALKLYEDCYISSITVYEMKLGALKAGRSSDLEQVLPFFRVLPFGQKEAEVAAELDKELTGKLF